MIFSQKYNFIFIANPKTGTVSVQKLLQTLDPECIRSRIIYINGKRYNIFGHARAKEIKSELGGKNYNNLRSFTFIRHPRSKIVSSYFFYRNHHVFIKKRLTFWWKFSRSIKVLIAKILPFKIWALVYPYKSNHGYVTDKNDNIIVDYIGKFENLEEDFFIIMDNLNVDYSGHNFPKLNTSKHKDYNIYYRDKWFKRLIDIKVRKDLKLYNALFEEGLYNLA